MLSLGIGMKSALMSELESYGGLKSVEVSSPGRYDDSAKDKDPEETLLTDARVEEFGAMEHVTSVDPCLQAQVVIKCGIYEGSFTIQGVSRSVLEEKAESLGQGSIPTEGGELQLLYGNMIPADFMNTRTNSYEYWDTGELPDMDLMNDQVFVIFDTEKY